MKVPFLTLGSMGVSQGFANDAAYIAAFGTPLLPVFYYNTTDQQFRYWNGSAFIPFQGTGSVSGPGASTTNALARWNGTSGNALLNSSVTLDAGGNMLWGPDKTGNIGSVNGSVFLRPSTAYIGDALHVNGTDPSAMLSLTSLTKGFLQPRMATSDRDAITSPTEGLSIYNQETHSPNFWNGSAWVGMPSVVLPSVLSAVAVFDNTSGTLTSSAVRVGTSTVGGLGNLFWPQDATSDIGFSDFIQFAPNAAPMGVIIDGSDNVYVVGGFTNTGYIVPFVSTYLAAMNGSGGPLKNSAGTALSDVSITDGAVNYVAVDRVNNRLYVSGAFTSAGTSTPTPVGYFAGYDLATKTLLAGINSGTASLDSMGGPIAVDMVAGGQVYINNPSGTYNGSPTGNIIRIDGLTGAIDPTFNAAGDSFDGPVTAIVLQYNVSPPAVLVIGSFSNFGATPAPGIIRLLPDGTVDTSFVVGTGFTGGTAVTGVHGGFAGIGTGYLIGGDFTDYNGTSAFGLVSLDETGAVNGTWPAGGVEDAGSNPASVSYICANYQDQDFAQITYIVGGAFTAFNGDTTYGNLMYLDESGNNLFGGIGENFPQNPTINGTITGIAVNSNSGALFFTGTLASYTNGFGTTTPLTDILRTNYFDWSFAPMGDQELARPRSVYVADLLQVGPSPDNATSYVNILNQVDSGLRGVVNTQAINNNVTSPAYITQKAQGNLSTPGILQGSGDELALFIHRGWNGSYSDMAATRVVTDGGFGTRFNWSVQRFDGGGLDSNGTMYLNNLGELVLKNHLLWSFEPSSGSIGDINPTAVATLRGVTFRAKVAGPSGNFITVTFANDGTGGAETVTTTGTWQPVTAAVVITVHMQDGVSTVQNIIDAINAYSGGSITFNLLYVYNAAKATDTVTSGSATLVQTTMGRPHSIHAYDEMSIGAESYHTRQYTTTTNNNTPVSFDVTVKDSLSMMIEVRAVCRRISGAGSAGDSGYAVVRGLLKNIAGTPVFVQVSTDSYFDNTTTPPSVDLVYLSPSPEGGQQFGIQLTGISGTLVWAVTYITQQV